MGPISFSNRFKPQQHIPLQNALVLVEKSSIFFAGKPASNSVVIVHVLTAITE